MKPSIENKLCLDYISLPFTVPASKLSLPFGNFTSDVVVPVAVNKKFVILDGNTAIELPDYTPVQQLFETIRTTERGYWFSVPGVFYVEVYTTDEGIVCDIWNKNQTVVTDSSYIYFSELIEVNEDFVINEGDKLKLSETFVNLSEMEGFNFASQFHTIASIANVDIDVENDGVQALLVDQSTNERFIGMDKIKAHIEKKGVSMLEVIEASRREKAELPQNLLFDPVLNFTLTTNDQDYDTVFHRLYQEELVIEPNALLSEAYAVLASELFV